MKYFSWSFVAADLSQNDPIKLKAVYQEKLVDILDLLIIIHFSTKVEEMKKNKSML
jgi:hypothetical protein